jgi:hypothetical protein
LAHEPAAVVLGFRGPRRRRELARVAVRWLAVCLAVCCGAAVSAAMLMPSGVRWSLAVPAVPAGILTAAMVAGREKSWHGEAAAALAFAGVAVPVVLAAGATAAVALGVAVPFALLYVMTSFAVRVAILRVRGGGDPEAVAATRRATYVVAAAACALVSALTMTGRLERSVLVASAPGIITAVLVALRPPSPRRLRTLGWTLVGVSMVTAAIVIATT